MAKTTTTRILEVYDEVLTLDRRGQQQIASRLEKRLKEKPARTTVDKQKRSEPAGS